ncbi:hypothetical protein L7E35_004681 [Vibrio parahaemolyticus]|nr:hypothetical protein [Vibrio parahaemolyticus]EIV1599735.1 hypothetical protein [Vibrio parahaemolyticus]
MINKNMFEISNNTNATNKLSKQDLKRVKDYIRSYKGENQLYEKAMLHLATNEYYAKAFNLYYSPDDGENYDN